MTEERMSAEVCTRYGPPEVLQPAEIEKPVPRDNEVCVRIYATAVTASDCIVRSGKVDVRLWLPMRLALGFGKPRNPVLGMVLAGEVESVGTRVGSFKKGDRVFGMNRFVFGTYAEYKCEPENGVIALKPSNLTFEETAAIPFGGLLALHFLKKANVGSGQRVLVYGASGAVGTSAVQLARCFGAKVTGVCSTANLELVKSLGADKVVDYTKDDLAVMGESYDLVFDAVGKSKSSPFKQQCKRALAPDGKYVSVDDGTPKLCVENLVLLRELAEAGKLKPVIDRSYPPEQIAEAHRYVERGHKKGNVIIKVA
ncbi:MAG TPA: NAD(P)-dependent alcohol dehydrogenase [Methanocella sp.]|jgi:NADPH:quinone reductase-like Zn-dependent oxidoreductase